MKILNYLSNINKFERCLLSIIFVCLVYISIFKIFNLQEKIEKAQEDHLRSMQGRAYDSFQQYKKEHRTAKKIDVLY